MSQTFAEVIVVGAGLEWGGSGGGGGKWCLVALCGQFGGREMLEYNNVAKTIAKKNRKKNSHTRHKIYEVHPKHLV